MCDTTAALKADLRIESSVFASTRTGAHYVTGEIRRQFLQGGGIARFGYPTTDEVPTPDGIGLMTRFEKGTVFWYPGQKAEVGEPVVRGRHEPVNNGAGRALGRDVRPPPTRDIH
jgi:hypothetical protein